MKRELITSDIQELTLDQVEQVSGGILPFIAAVVIIDVALIAFTAGVVEGVSND